MSKFYNYSFNNVLLIARQKPDASLVAGFSAWKKQFGRYVKKGEKGIKIIAPVSKKVKEEVKEGATGQPAAEDGEKEEKTRHIIAGFKVVSVFDVSQTEGKELPAYYGAEELSGDINDYSDFFEAVKETSPVPVEFEDIPGHAQGYYHQTEKRIALQEGMSELQNVKTLIHETAHAKLHAINPEKPEKEPVIRTDQSTREVQAESIAYVVCQHFGLDTSDYSFAYIAGWSTGKELPELRASLEIIRDTAKKTIEEINVQLSMRLEHQIETPDKNKEETKEMLPEIERTYKKGQTAGQRKEMVRCL